MIEYLILPQILILIILIVYLSWSNASLKKVLIVIALYILFVFCFYYFVTKSISKWYDRMEGKTSVKIYSLYKTES